MTKLYFDDLTKPYIKWKHVAAKYVAMATDANGKTWVYEKLMPVLNYNIWLGGKSDCAPAEAFASFRPGACTWRDSLVHRPGFEPKTEGSAE